MSGVLAGLATHVGGFLLSVDSFQLFADGHPRLAVVSWSLAALLVIGFYVWGFFQLNKRNGIV